MQDNARPAMLENRLSKTACAVVLLFMALALFGFNVFCTYSGINMPLWTSSVFEAVILLIPCVMLCLLCGSPVPHAKMSLKRTALVIGMGCTGYVFTMLLTSIWATVWTSVFSGNEVNTDGMIDMMDAMASTPLWALLLIIALTPAICEEFFFRGMLMKSLSVNPAAAICISSALFALLHYDMTKLYSTFAIGMFIGWIVMRSGNLTAGMILHFINNAFSVLLLKGVTVFYDMLGGMHMSEEAVYDALMADPTLLSIATMALLAGVLLFVLSIPVFILCLILFLRDTREDAEAIHLAALQLSEAGEGKDRLGTVLLIVTAVVMTGVMLYSHGVF